MELFLYIISDAAIYFGLVLSLWISFRILGYPDLALEQTFVLGGACLVFVIHNNLPVWLLFPFLVVLAAFLGIACGVVRNVFRVHAIIVSLIASYIYYSLSLAIMGAPNVFIGSDLERLSFLVATAAAVLLFGTFLLISALTKRTKAGLMVIAAGSNWDLASRHQLMPILWYSLGLSMAFLCALCSGALFAWRAGYHDVTAGNGFLLISIFVVIFTFAFQKRINLLSNGGLLMASLVLYLFIIQIALRLRMPPIWLRGFSAFVLLALVCLLPKHEKRILLLR